MPRIMEIKSLGGDCQVIELMYELQKLKPEDKISIGVYRGMAKLVVNDNPEETLMEE